MPVDDLISKYGSRAVGQAGVRGLSSLEEKYSSPEIKKVGRTKPGEHWSNPLQEQHPDVNRAFVMNFEASTPETMARALSENFEVKHRGGLDFSIRKPGEKKWKVVDPDTWTDMLPFIGGDWSDIAGDAATGMGSMIGALLTSPGVVSTAAGAAGGAGVVEAAKQALGKLLGGHATSDEIQKSIEFEAALGAGGELGAAAAKPVLKKLGMAGRRALLGNADEVVKRNAEKLAAYEKAVAEAPMERATVPEGMGLRQQVREGFTTPAEALAEAQARGDTKTAEWITKYIADRPTAEEAKRMFPNVVTKAPWEPKLQPTDVPRPDLETPAHGLLGRFRRGGEKAARGLALAETQGVQELLDLSDDALRARAAEVGVETTRKATIDEVRDAIIKQHEDVTQQGIKAAQRELDRTSAVMARKTGTEAGKAKLEREAAQRKLDALREALARGPAPTTAKLLDKADAIVKKINEGDIFEAERLGISLDVPHEALALRVFEQQATPRQVKAVRGQIDEVLERIGPEREFQADYIAKAPSKEGRGPAESLRTFRGTQEAPLDPAKWRETIAETEGMSLAEGQSRLRQSGWEGPIPPTMPEVQDALYQTKFGVKGVGSPENLTGPEFIESAFNVESAARRERGLRSPRRTTRDAAAEVSPMETIRKERIGQIRAGGELLEPGRAGIEPSRIRSAALAARPAAQAVGRGAERVGHVMTAPQRGLEKLVDVMLPESVGPRAGDWVKKIPSLSLMGGITGGALGFSAGPLFAAIAATTLLGKGVQKIGHKLAADGSGQALVELASRAPAEIAERMLRPLEALAEAGPWKYRAAIWSMLHQSDIRTWVREEERKMKSEE